MTAVPSGSGASRRAAGWVGQPGPWATPELAFRLEQRLVRTQADGRAPSVTAAVTAAGETVWAGAVGLAEVEPARAAGAGDQYRVGSITKLFTAAAVLQLRDEGLVGLDEPLGRHLREVPPALGATRIADALAHLSAMQREPPGGIWESHRGPDHDELRSALTAARTVGRPGAYWHYSNLAYGLLGELVAQVRGAPYRDVVSRSILRPLGLDRTTWEPAGPHARGYDVHPYSDHVRPCAPMDLRALSGLGQLWSTAADLGRWGCFLAGSPLADGVLGAATLDEMHEPRAVLDGSWDSAGGLGPKLFRHDGRVLGGHAGGMPGFVAMVVYDREERVAAAALANAGTGPALRALALELCAAVAVAAHRSRPWAPGPPPPAPLASLLGPWWSGDESVVLRWRAGSLELVDPGEPGAPPTRLVASGDGFRAEDGGWRGEVMELDRDAGGSIRAFWLATYRYQRQPDGDAAGQGWRR